MTNPKLHPEARVLTLDIETKPAIVYQWSAFQKYTSPEMIIEPDGVLCVGAKWAGEDEPIFYSEWEHGTVEMLRETAKLIHDSDAIVGVNHEKFDLPWLMGEFARFNVPAPPKPTLIDLQKYWKRHMRFFSNKLAYVGPILTGKGKVEHEGFELWPKVMNGDKEAQAKMKEYCIGDVTLTEDLYFKLREFLPNHPFMSNTKHANCPACDSPHVHVSKYRRTRTMRIQQLHCQNCGHYFDGTRQRMTPTVSSTKAKLD